MDKNNIKNLLNQTFVNEAKVPGLEVTNKAKSESGKENKKAVKDMEDELADYDKESKKDKKDAIKPVKFNYTDDSEQEYHQEMEIMNGQEMIQYDRTPSELYKKRAEDAIAGANYMGNSPDWANVVVPGQGGDPTFGKKLVKAIKASAKKRSDDTPTSKMFGDDWEIVQDKSHKAYAMENTKNNKETIKESEKMKRLKFKKPFNGANNALNLIPENYKVDNKVFEMTDGNESYKVRWEGSLNEGKGVVLIASDATLVNEDVQKMKHLMGYNSKETFGNLKGAERLAEDKNFSKIWDKTKSLLSEGMDEWTKKQLDTFDGDGDGTPFEPEDMAALRKDEGSMYEAGMYEMDAMGGMDQQTPINQAKIKGDMMSTLKQDVTKMSTNEKGVFDNMIVKLGDLLSQSGNQVTGQVKNLMDRINTLIDTELAAKQQNQEPAGMPVTEEGDIEEMDRFDEVFSGLGEDDTMEEGMFSNFFGMDREIAKALATPEGKEVADAYGTMSELEWFNKYAPKISSYTRAGGVFDRIGTSSVQIKDIIEYLKAGKYDPMKQA
jgi:hypothetical protein